MSASTPRSQADVDAALFAAVVDMDHTKRDRIETAITAGGNINARNGDGHTPLHCLLQVPDQNTQTRNMVMFNIKTLLRAGADMDATTPDGRTVADLMRPWYKDLTDDILDAERRRRADPWLLENIYEIMPYWARATDPVTPELQHMFFEACDSVDTEQIKYMLHLWPDAARWRDEQNRTPLMWAILSDQCGDLAFNALIGGGADIDARDQDGASIDDYIRNRCEGSAELLDSYTTALKNAVTARQLKRATDIAAPPAANVTELQGRMARDPLRQKLRL